jgi:hypothetical protein
VNGNPTAWPLALAGDRTYHADWINNTLFELGITPVLLSKENEDHDTRPVDFDREIYCDRNIVEHLIGWLKESHCIFSRFEKTANNFGCIIKMAFIRRYLGLVAGGTF